MATLTPCIKHVKKNGTAAVKIKISHNSTHAFLDTKLVVTQKELTPDGKLKRSFYNKSLNDSMARFRNYIGELGNRVEDYNINELKEYLLRQDNINSVGYIDFIGFCIKKNEKIKEEKGENGTYGCNKTAIEWLKKFAKTDTLNINSIKKAYLEDFEQFMRKNGLGTAGISCYLRALRTFFIAAQDEYNDEANEIYHIKHYPFKNFKIKEHIADKRSVETNVVRIIKDAQAETKREELGRDMFMLTFCLAGIAPIDLYLMKEPTSGYTEYIRDKVKSRNGKIKVRIKVGKEAQSIIDKYSTNGFLSDIKRYVSEKEFSCACRKGLESLIARLNKKSQEEAKDKKSVLTIPDVTLYWARHTFATIAGGLGFDTNLIDFALGHKPRNAKMAEVYITRSQESVDKLVNAVIKEVYSDGLKKKSKKKPPKV